MKLIFLTNSFPYPNGEQFIESEIQYLGESGFDEVTILPVNALGEPRTCPSNIRVDPALAQNKSILWYALKAPLTKLFLNEIILLKRNKKLNYKTSIQALKTVAQVTRCYENLKKWIEKNGKVDVAYSYWNDVSSYAACLAKDKKLINKVISRAHGFDVYEERRPNNYMPLKRQFNNAYEMTYVLSNQAKNYFISRYGFNEKNLEISPLGVQVSDFNCEATDDNKFNLVSVSFCLQVKRIDKIINAIAQLALENPSLIICWTHIGDGPLKMNLVDMAKQTFRKYSNISFSFKGHLENKEVIRYYKDNRVDCLINTSESEGIPVSIMEAMAAGVPAIATDVGSVSELVKRDNGWLLSKDPTILEVKDALQKMCYKAKTAEFRESARTKIKKDYNSEINYRIFIKRIQYLLM